MDWYERRVAEYKEDTWDLSLAEHGAYTLLLDHYYANESPLPDNDRALSSICNCSDDEWLTVKENVLSFFVAKNGKLRHAKCEKILRKAFSLRKDGAKRTAKYRKTKKPVTRDQRVSDAPTLQDTTLQDKKKIDKENFDQWREVYPVKKDVVVAWGEYLLALGRATAEELLDGAKRVRTEAAGMSKAELKFVKGPVNWLKGDCWRDGEQVQLSPEAQAKNEVARLENARQMVRGDLRALLDRAERHKFDPAPDFVKIADTWKLPLADIENIAAEMRKDT